MAGVRDLDPMARLHAALRRLPDGAVFSGLTAAWLHGIDVAPCAPIEATVPPDAGVSARSGIAVRRSTVKPGEVVNIRRMPATSIVRTVGDVCSRLPLTEAVVIADAAVHDGRLRLEQLRSWAHANHGHRGVRTLRRVLDLVEPRSESPMESRLRMVLVLAGLPRPQAQVPIHDADGRFVGRPDLYYEDRRLGIEYDGAAHRDALTSDNRRQNNLVRAGIQLLRFTASDVLGNPDTVVRQVREMLASAGTRRIRARRHFATAGTRH